MCHDVDIRPSGVFQHHGVSDVLEDPRPKSFVVCKLTLRHFRPHIGPRIRVNANRSEEEVYNQHVVHRVYVHVDMLVEQLDIVDESCQRPRPMSKVMYTLGAHLYEVLFFGIKMFIWSDEAVINNFIRRYRDHMGAAAMIGHNMFREDTRPTW